eukprot:11289574-Ditylum_brightwellii.AAC.1
MQHTIRVGIAPYPNPPARALGSLGAYVWAKAFEQLEQEVVANLHGSYKLLAMANGTTAISGVANIARIFEAICWAEEPLVFLAMMPLDVGKVPCVHCANMFRSYSSMGTEALNGKTT